MSVTDKNKTALEELEDNIGYYDMPEHEDTLPVSGWALCELMDEVKRWRETHKAGEFNPDYCAASEALTEHLEHCKASLTPQPTAWQEIGSAPRDGTVVLCCVIGCTPSTAMFLETPMGRSGWSTEYKEAFVDEDEFESYMADNVYNPTHWLPLPHPPTEGEKK